MTDYFAPDSCAFCGEIGKHAATCKKATPPPAPTAAEQAQPVAQWQMRETQDDEWRNVHSDAVDYFRRDKGYFVRPLYATPVPEQAQPAGVTDEQMRGGFREYDLRLSGGVRYQTAWQVWRDAVAWVAARAQEGEKP